MRKLMLALALAVAASACGGGGGGGGLPQQQRLEDTFGAGFGQAFRANPNSDPRDPAAGDVVPADLTRDATPIP